MEPYMLGHDEGESLWVFDALDTIKADEEQTGGSFSLVEFLDFEGSTVPLHLNEKWDRGFYVLEGEYTFFIGEDAMSVSNGSWVFVPRNTPHAWRCNSSRGRLLNLTAPPGVEKFYRQVGEAVTDRSNLPVKKEPDVRALIPIAEKHGIKIMGPPPDA
jgi:quercetin dioxygenase-like cupin family protein